MRPIDADELIKEIEKQITKIDENISDCEWMDDRIGICQLWATRANNFTFIKKIEEQPTVNDWIPCSKQMPKRTEEGYYKTVLVTIKKEKQPCMGVWRDDCKQWWVRRNEGETLYSVNNNVVAWQYLPQTYKGE